MERGFKKYFFDYVATYSILSILNFYVCCLVTMITIFYSSKNFVKKYFTKTRVMVYFIHSVTENNGVMV